MLFCVAGHLLVKEEEEMEKNLAPASLAIAFPIIVFPVPATQTQHGCSQSATTLRPPTLISPSCVG